MKQLVLDGFDEPDDWPYTQRQISRAWSLWREWVFVTETYPWLLDAITSVVHGEVEEIGSCGCGYMREQLRDMMQKLEGVGYSNNLAPIVARHIMLLHPELSGCIAIAACPADVVFAKLAEDVT